MWYRIVNEQVHLNIRATPGAAKNQFLGLHGDYLKVSVKAIPENGAANTELIKFLADYFKLSRQSILLLRGETARYKLIQLPLTEAVEKFIKTA